MKFRSQEEVLILYKFYIWAKINSSKEKNLTDIVLGFFEIKVKFTCGFLSKILFFKKLFEFF